MGTVAEMLAPKAAKAAPAANDFDQFEDTANPFDQFDVAAAAPTRTAGDLIGMGARGVATGLAGIPDFLTAAVNGPLNVASELISGKPLVPTGAVRANTEAAADKVGLAKPETSGEQLRNSIIEGVTQGVATAGAGIAGSGAAGAGGALARTVAASPVTDLVASGTSTGAQEQARQSGAGPVGQTVAALLGAVGGVGGVAAAEGAMARVAAKFGPKAAKIVEEIPEQVAFDEKGKITDDGREAAAQNDIHPAKLKEAYEEAAKPDETPAPVAEPAPVQEAAPVAPEAVPEPVAVTPRAVEPAEAAAPPEPAMGPTPANDVPLPASAVARTEQAATEGVPLTRGQATQDFGIQNEENTLKTQASAPGEQARQFYATQQQKISEAVDRFKSAFGDTTATAEERGQAVKDAVSSLRDAGKAGVSALYNQARDAALKLGEAGENLIHLDTAPILSRMREIFIDEAVPEQVRKALKQQAAKYGLIGENPKTVEGETTVQLRDSNGDLTGRQAFTGPPQRLTIANAEDLRKVVNSLFEQDTSHAAQSLKPLIDEAVSQAVERAATVEKGGVGEAFKSARAAHQAQKATFDSGDIVSKVVGWKRGAKGVPTLEAHAVIKAIFGDSPDALVNIRKIKAVLLSKPTEASKAAWKAIQAHAVAKLFDDAFITNSNPGGGALGTISGAKLNTAIGKFGVDKLKLLLSPEDFNQLMKLRRIIGDATIPINGTVNHSNTAQKVIAFLGAQSGKVMSGAAHLVPGLGPLLHGGAALAKIGKEAAQAEATLEGVTSFTPKAARAAETAKPKGNPVDYARRFIKVAGSDQILAPLMAAAANEERP